MHLESKKQSALLFWCLFCVYALTYMTKNCFGAAMTAIVSEGIMTKSETGLISALFYLIYAPGQIIGGMLADRVDPIKLIACGLVGAGVANAVIYLDQSYYIMLIAWSLNAVVQMGIWPSVFKIISSQLAREYRQQAAMLISFSMSAGLVLSYLVGAFMPRWQDNFALSAVVLPVSAFFIWIVYRRMSRHMVSGGVPTPQNSASQAAPMPTGKLFLLSGFFILIPMVILRTVAEQSIKVLSPTMLMESYTAVSPTTGNLLNIVILLMSIAGALLARYVLYPRIMRDELSGTLITLVFQLPLTGALFFIGKLPLMMTLVLLSLIALLSAANYLYITYYNMRFAHYGKDGTAAGIINAACSIGLVLQNYAVVRVAEAFADPTAGYSGWQAVALLLCGMLAISILCTLAAQRLWRRFKSTCEVNR